MGRCGASPTFTTAVWQHSEFETPIVAEHSGTIMHTRYPGCELWGMHSPQAAVANKARADVEQALH